MSTKSPVFPRSTHSFNHNSDRGAVAALVQNPALKERRFQRQTMEVQLLLHPLYETKTMSPIETELLQALLDLEANIKPAGTPGPRPSLLPFFERIDQLGAKLGPDADPSLRHYLQKKSYQKARFFLQGRDAENVDGPCGHV